MLEKGAKKYRIQSIAESMGVARVCRKWASSIRIDSEVPFDSNREAKVSLQLSHDVDI